MNTIVVYQLFFCFITIFPTQNDSFCDDTLNNGRLKRSSEVSLKFSDNGRGKVTIIVYASLSTAIYKNTMFLHQIKQRTDLFFVIINVFI